MKKILPFFFICVIVASFNSCEQPTEVSTPTTTEEEPAVVESDSTAVDDDTTTPPVQPSPIKGLWECQLSGGYMILNFGDSEVEYFLYFEIFESKATYKGKYTIDGKDITIQFNSLTKNGAKVRYTPPEDMPKDAVLKNENTIVYIDKEYKRKN